MLKNILVAAAVIVLGVAVYAYSFARDVSAIVSGYVAQSLCTNVLMLGREQAEVEALDLSQVQLNVTTSVVHDDSVVTIARLGPVSHTTVALHRPGLGCANTGGLPMETVRGIGLEREAPERVTRSDSNWPAVTTNLTGVDYPALQVAVDGAFIETSDDIYTRQNTRALLVSYKGHILAERYGQGFDAQSPLRGMSMTKSVTSALVGILVGQGKLDINAAAPIRDWSELQDGRSRVSTHHLLKMTAGFDYNEAYETDPRNLLNTMLMTQPDMPAYAANTALISEPGDSWDYQTTHSVLLQEVIRNTLGDDQAYFRFPQEQLFAKLGMHNSFFQADAMGTFIGGAFMFATGRDWMRLGLLFLNDGVHEGERILPQGWVEYSTTPSAASLLKRAYGAQIWLNSPSPQQLFPGMPEDAYAFQGHYGQYVIVIPSLELVVVRLGMTFNGEKGFDKQALLRDVVAALTAI